MSSETVPPSSCPMDPAAREVWLKKARATGERSPHLISHISIPSTSSTSSFFSRFSFRFPAPHDALSRQTQVKTSTQKRPKAQRSLSQEREVSTIPRADPTYSKTTPNPSSKPLNNEQETGAHLETGNWIYPSEKMFFDAMRRKNYDPQAPDMATIIPIHNAVNERAWNEIKQWEEKFEWSRRANLPCGGPRLHSFSGDSKKLSPKARWNMIWGYTEPFDRHDWVVERCPGRPGVEYVIDFYEGKSSEAQRQQGKILNFYLDVRPKLNSWEGWRMRLANFITELW